MSDAMGTGRKGDSKDRRVSSAIRAAVGNVSELRAAFQITNCQEELLLIIYLVLGCINGTALFRRYEGTSPP